MAARANDRDSRLIDLTEMNLKEIARLDVALIDEAVGELLSRCSDTGRLLALQVRTGSQMLENLPARA